MANDLTNFTPEIWSKRVQNLLTASLVGTQVANAEEREGLSAGDKIHRPYMSDVVVQDYTKGTAVTIQDIDTTDEYLEINKTKVAPFYVDAVDGVQNCYNTVEALSRRCAYRLRDNIDQAVLNEIENASLASESVVTLGTTNIVSTFSEAKVALFDNDVANENLVAVVSPDTAAIIEQYFAANGFQTADEALVNGYMGNWMGMKVYHSTNLPSEATLTFADNVLAANTVTVNGVVFKFVATPTDAGDVDLGSDADTSIGNLVAAINGAAGAGTTYIEVSASDRRKLTNKQVTAVGNTTDDTIVVTAFGKMTLAKYGTNLSWSDQTLHHLVGQKGCIDLAIQKEVNTEMRDVADKLGKNYLTWTLYGVKTFQEGKERMFDLQVKA